MTPGRKPSMSTSAAATSASTTSLSSSDLRSATTFVRPRRTWSVAPASSAIARGPGRATRMTSAPMSASCMAACGTGPSPAISTTRRPVSGPTLTPPREFSAGLVSEIDPGQQVGLAIGTGDLNLDVRSGGAGGRQIAPQPEAPVGERVPRPGLVLPPDPDPADGIDAEMGRDVIGRYARGQHADRERTRIAGCLSKGRVMVDGIEIARGSLVPDEIGNGQRRVGERLERRAVRRRPAGRAQPRPAGQQVRPRRRGRGCL